MLEIPELEQRLSNLQSQVERLWRQAESNVPPVEQRLATMADQYAEYLRRWAATVERHTNAVRQLEAYAAEWKDASSRVRQEAADRLQDLETTIGREWETLKTMAELPVRELRAQAESLTQVSQAMTTASQQGLDRAEARFASFQTEVHHRLDDLTHELHAALSEIRTRLEHQQPRLDGTANWSLDDVTRLHGQIRGGARAGEIPGVVDQRALPASQRPPSGSLADIDSNWTSRTRSEGSALTESLMTTAHRRNAAVALGAVLLAIAVLLGWRMQGQINSAAERARVAEQKSDAVVRDASRQADTARAEAQRQISSARDMAYRAQRIGDVLAAPDLIRFNLAGGNGASGQALFSRSRGFVVSGSHLPPPPPNRTHQVWLLTRLAPVKAGTFMPDQDGSVTLVQDTPTVPRAVVGVMVTAEASDGGENPAGPAVLSSVRTQLEEEQN